MKVVSDRALLTPAFLGMADIFGTKLASSEVFRQAFETALDKLETNGVFAALKSLQGA
jgi:mannitol 2-dehydrogenase